MSTISHFKILAAFPLLLLAFMAESAAGAQTSTSARTAQDDQTYIYLGKVKVTGQKQIMETLQAIKVGLQMPYSSDPKLANVVVCRLVDEAGAISSNG